MTGREWWERGQWVDYFNARANPEIDPPNGGDDGRGGGGGDEEAPILGLHEGPKPSPEIYQAGREAGRLEAARNRFDAEQAQLEAEQAEEHEIDDDGLDGTADDDRDDGGLGDDFGDDFGDRGDDD